MSKFDIGNTGEDTGLNPDNFKNSKPQSPPGGDELDKLCMDLWITDPYKVPFTDVVPQAKAQLDAYILAQEEKAYRRGYNTGWVTANRHIDKPSPEAIDKFASELETAAVKLRELATQASFGAEEGKDDERR